MQDIRILEQKPESIVLETSNGEQFRLKLTEDALAVLKNVIRASRSVDPKVKPREIQAMLRSGLSAQQTAENLKVDLEDVQRYEGPIIAERNFMLRRAQNVEVRTEARDSDVQETFGNVINERIKDVVRSTPEWSVYKNELDPHWVVKVRYQNGVPVAEALWSFDHRKGHLEPLNDEAENLSKQSDFVHKPGPTLRAVEHLDSESSFDSGAFEIVEPVKMTPEPAHEVQATFEPEVLAQAAENEEQPEINESADERTSEPLERTEEEFTAESAAVENHADFLIAEEYKPRTQTFASDYERRNNIDQRAIHHEPETIEPHGETEDLLEALRKRRSQRQPEIAEPEIDDTRLIDLPTDSIPHFLQPATLETVEIDLQGEREFPDTDEIIRPPKSSRAKKGRTSVPSWDEILFGKNDSE